MPYHESDDMMWLGWAVSRSPLWALDDASLLRRVTPDLEGEHRKDVLQEIDRRLTHWGPQQLASLTCTLADLEKRHREPGRAALNVDRTLRRLLRHSNDADELVKACLTSDRSIRQRAAWHNYADRGVPEDDVGTLAALIEHEPHWALVRAVSTSAQVLRRVDLARLLAGIERFYLRGQVLQTLLEAGEVGCVEHIAHQWPVEVLFAIRRARHRDSLGLVTQILREHGHRPDVITAAIQAYGELGGGADLLRATELGKRALASGGRSRPLTKEW